MAKLVSKVYGDALFEAAREAGRMDDMYEEVLELQKLLQANEELQKMMENPKVIREDKENVIETHIRKKKKNKSLSEINSTDVLQWQNELLSQRDDDGKGYSQTYLRTIQNQLNAIFNHAVKYYDLAKNLLKRLRKVQLIWQKKHI